VAYVPFHDAPPVEWGLVWQASRQTARIQTFHLLARKMSPIRRD
jgi:hypothetical protein